MGERAGERSLQRADGAEMARELRPPAGGRRIRKSGRRRSRDTVAAPSISPEARRPSLATLGSTAPSATSPERHLYALVREGDQPSDTIAADRGAAPPAALSATGYDVTDVGGVPPNHSASFVAALNQLGQVAGYSWEGAWPGRDAIVWTPGGTDGPEGNPQIRGLGNFSGQPASMWHTSQAWGLNNSGQVVGWANGTDLLLDPIRACMWEGGSIVDLGALMPNGSSMARAINDNGRAVGSADTRGGPSEFTEHAIVIDVDSRELTDLGIDNSTAFDVNTWGQVVGAYFTAEWVQHVLYWDPANGAWDLHPLVTLGGTSSRANMINNSGQVAGWATDQDRQWQGFVCDLYTGWVAHIGGVTDSLATAVNNHGLAVGRYRGTPSTLSYRALGWDLATDTVVDLNQLTGDDDWTLFEAWGVNDAGQIAGFGAHRIDDIYYQRGFLLTPAQT